SSISSCFSYFSSRRRHTRFSRDWSPDVCSSDLGADDPGAEPPGRLVHMLMDPVLVQELDVQHLGEAVAQIVGGGRLQGPAVAHRSEERRAGKWGTSWSSFSSYFWRNFHIMWTEE